MKVEAGRQGREAFRENHVRSGPLPSLAEHFLCTQHCGESRRRDGIILPGELEVCVYEAVQPMGTRVEMRRLDSVDF